MDTSVLLKTDKYNFKDFEKVNISIVSLEELDNLKSHEQKGYQARQAIRNIKDATNVEIKLNYKFTGANKFLMHNNDNTILAMAYETCVQDNEFVFLSDDYNLIIKAEALGMNCSLFEFKEEEFETYTGIRETWLTEQEYVDLLEGLNKNPYNLYLNEYLIVNNITSNEQYLFMWNGKSFEEVKTKPITNKYLDAKEKIQPLDVYQKAFIHMLQNDRVKIKITDSPYGSGKSYLMIHWALQMLEHREKFNKMYFVKSDSSPKGRKEFPAIPGGVEEKSAPLLGVLCDTTSEENITDILLRNNKLEILPIQFAKGRSLRKSILYINECQDFTPSEMERLLSRVGEDTVVLLDGSTHQIDNRYCFYRNGLSVASDNFKDKSIVAQVNMINDYRSEISKMISQMNWHD